MATTFAVDDLLMVRLEFYQAQGNARAFNVLHYRVVSLSGTPPALYTALGAIGQEMFEHFSGDWAPAASSQVEFTGVSVQSLFPLPRSVLATYSPSGPAAGESMAEALPLQDAPTLLKKTDFGQRWGLGRVFYVGLAEDGQEGGILEATSKGQLETFAGLLDDEVTAGVGGWAIVLQPVLKGGPDDNPTRITPIRRGVLSDTVLKTQRRRRPGKGI